MAIIKRRRKSGTRYQAKIRGTDGAWISETFTSFAEAKQWEARFSLDKLNGKCVINVNRKVTVAEYFSIWHEETNTSKVSEGWRITQKQIFRDYIEKIIGPIQVVKVTPAHINRVILHTVKLGRSEGTQLHVYAVLHKMFADAVELFQILEFNPVLKRLKPTLIEKEAKFLTVEEAKSLLNWVRGKPFELAIWIGLYVARRVGEIQALKWEHVDFVRNKIHIRGTYRRKEKKFKDYPKGRKWHSVDMPPELRALLLKTKETATGEYVATSPRRDYLPYDGYYKALKRYCQEVGVTEIGTHGLRHSTAEIWQEQGASRDDIQKLMAHSSSKVTDRYIHDKGGRLEKVAEVIRLFPSAENPSCSPKCENVPQKSGGRS